MATRTHFPSTRRFGGEDYHLRAWHKTKREAQDDAAANRKHGGKARVVKDKFALGNVVYLVYARR